MRRWYPEMPGVDKPTPGWVVEPEPLTASSAVWAIDIEVAGMVDAAKAMARVAIEALRS